PILIAPETGAGRVRVPVSLTWTTSSNASAYDVYAGTSGLNVAQATNTSPEYLGRQSGTSMTAASLAYLALYYWRVAAVGRGKSTTSVVQSFTTQRPPLAAPLISSELEVTDSTQGHTVGNAPNPECSQMVRVGNSLDFVYRCATPI